MFYPHVGGIEKHLEKVSKTLIKKGHKVTVLTTKYNKDLTEEEIYKDIRIIRFNQPSIKYIGLVITWFSLLKYFKLIKKSDILHIHDAFSWYWPFKLIYPEKKVFITYHGRWGRYPIPFVDLVQKKIGAKLSSGVLAIGEYIPKHYGLNADIVSYGATDINKTTIDKDNNLIVYVGRLDKDIALDKIFEVFKRLKGYKIIFCGDGEFKEEAKKYGEVKGFVDPIPYLKKAKYCFASGYLTILEALANKCLTFASYDNSLQEDYYKLTPFNNFISVTGRPDETVKKLQYYERHPLIAKEKIEKGYKWTKEQTWKKMAGNYLTLWKKA